MHEEHSSNSFGLSRLSYELGFHDEKNFNGISVEYMKNGHVKMTLLVRLNILREYNLYYESVVLKLIEVKKKGCAKRVLRLFFTFFRCLSSKSWMKSLDQQTLL